MFPVKNRKIFFSLSGIMILVALLSILFFGFVPSIDFNGGTILEIEYLDKIPLQTDIYTKIEPLSFGDVSVRPTGENGFIIRTRSLSEEERISLNQALSFDRSSPFKEIRFNSVGPVIGKELAEKAVIAIITIILITIIFIAFVFRKVSKPVSSWKYGIVAIVALIHDIIIPSGLISILGKFNGVEADALFVTALLALLGYSINDTIIIFDRIRENLEINKKSGEDQSFEEVIGNSLSSTYGRSINTSLTTFLVLASLFIFAGASTKYFILTLLVGIVAGTYSSIFLAAPLLVTLNNLRKKKDK